MSKGGLRWGRLVMRFVCLLGAALALCGTPGHGPRHMDAGRPSPPRCPCGPSPCCAPTVDGHFATPWLAPADRPAVGQLNLKVTTHAGEVLLLKRLVDRPTAVTFFYSRCTNPNK